MMPYKGVMLVALDLTSDEWITKASEHRRIPPRAYSDLFSFPLRTLVLKDASLQYTLPCDCGNLLICSIFTLGAKATGLMTPRKTGF